MARIVFAGELDSSGDRLHRSIPIAERLQAAGHSVTFIVADVIAANTLLRPKGIPFLSAPQFVARSLSTHRPANYWQILATLGDADRNALRARVRAWINLFDLLAADAIVIDRAPSALLAARISQRPVRLIERAVTLPPAHHQSSEAALENVNAILHALGGTSLSRLADLVPEVLPPHHAMSVTSYRPASSRVSERRRILYAWELGTNTGHLERGLAIAEGLRDGGHDVIFVVRDLSLAERLLAARGFDFMPTPDTPLLASPRPTVNFSDLLLICGFDEARSLGARVRAWTHLLRHLDPATIVIDHAPTAQLAAYIANLPAILVNSGFAIPPLTQPFPSIQPRTSVSSQQLSWADRQALDTVNVVLREFDAQPLSHLSELFARSTQIITTFKELDPYPGRDSGMHVGPVDRATNYAEAQWRTVGRTRVFAYLRPSVRGFEPLLRLLRACHGEVKCVLPGASAALVAQHRAEHFEIFTEPIELGSLLKEADVVISYGGAGLLARSLLAGVPLLLMPDALEQILNSVRVVELGAGIALFEDRSPETIMASLMALTLQARYRVAAREFAARYRDRPASACERAVAAIEQSC